MLWYQWCSVQSVEVPGTGSRMIRDEVCLDYIDCQPSSDGYTVFHMGGSVRGISVLKKTNPVMRREPATFDPYASFVPALTTGDHFPSKGSLPTVLVTKPENLECRWELIGQESSPLRWLCELKRYYWKAFLCLGRYTACRSPHHFNTA